MTTPVLGELLCEVCHDEQVVVMGSIPGVPFTVGYGQRCAEAGAHPYWVLVGNTAFVGEHDDDLAEWWIEMVHTTLRHLGKTEDEFWHDVERDRRAIAAALQGQTGEDPGPGAIEDPV